MLLISNIYSFFSVPNVILWSSTFCYIWLHVLELPSEEHVADYKFTVYVVGLCCIIESFMEPVYLFSQAFLYMRFRVSLIIITKLLLCRYHI